MTPHQLTYVRDLPNGYTRYRCNTCCQTVRIAPGREATWDGCPGERYVPEPPTILPTPAISPPSGDAQTTLDGSAWLANGGPVATREEQKRRLTICAKCGRLEECAPTQCAKRKLWETGACSFGKWDQWTYTPPSIDGRAELPAIATRHLIYHVYAARANDAWQRNLRQLARRWGAFNGRRIVAVALGPEAESLATVQTYLVSLLAEFSGVEWLTVPNDPELREVATFPALLREVRTTSSDAAVFFGHTKGVKPWGTLSSELAQGVVYWRNAMYNRLLDDPERIGALLRHWPTVGTCKIVWRQPGEIPTDRYGLVDRGQGASPYPTGLMHGEWMFGGTYFWARCDSLFGNWRWPFVPHDHYGAEAYLSGIFPAADGYSIYQPWDENVYPDRSAYFPQWHKDRIEDV